MSRRARIASIALAALAFLIISGLLARWLSLENVERDDVIALLHAEARGDSSAMLAQLRGCQAACRAVVATDAATLRGGGRLLILARGSATGYSLSSNTGPTRVAWQLGTRLPVVQCVLVRRTGNALTGLRVELLAIGAPIPSQADC